MPSAVIVGEGNEALVELLADLGLHTEEAPDIRAALESKSPVNLFVVSGSSTDPELESLRELRQRRPDAEILLVVPADESETGLALARLLHADLLFRPVDRRRARKTFERALERQQLQHRHHRLVERVRSIDSDAAREVEALAQDYGAQARALEEANRLRSAFLQNVSHEIRTPITVMQGFLDILAADLRERLGEDQLDLLQRVQESSASLLEIIQSILDLSKAEAGVLEARPTRVYFPHLVTELRRRLEPLLEGKPIRLVVDVPRGIEWLNVDGTRLRQVLAHLVSNAVKFTASGEIRVEARLHSSAPARAHNDPATLLRAASAEGDLLEIVVADTGKGISRLDQEIIFEAFRQVDPSSTREHEGLGLGLAIVKEMSRLLGASIDVASQPGEGTRFTLRLPVTAVAGSSLPETRPTLGTHHRPTPRSLDPRGVLPEIVNLCLASPASGGDAVAFALDFLERTIRPEAALFAERGLAGWKVTDAVGRESLDVGAGSPPPLPALLLDSLGREPRATRIAAGPDPSSAWSVVAVGGEHGGPPGLLAVRASGDGERAAADLRLLQVAGRWLELERGRDRLLRLHGDVIAAVGRDLKTPLGSLLAYTQVLLREFRGPLSPEQRDVALRLERTLHHVILSALDVLDAERATSSGFEVERRPFSLERVIDHVLARHGAAIELRRFRIIREIAPALAPSLGDEIHTDRALSNVLRALLERLPDAAEVRIRAASGREFASCTLSVPLADSAPFTESFTGPPRPLDLTDTLGLRLARGWIEAQRGSIALATDGGLLSVELRIPILENL